MEKLNELKLWQKLVVTLFFTPLVLWLSAYSWIEFLDWINNHQFSSNNMTLAAEIVFSVLWVVASIASIILDIMLVMGVNPEMYKNVTNNT